MEELRRELSLSVGESVRIGDHFITLIEVHEDEITLRIDPVSDFDSTESEWGQPAESRIAVLRAPR